MTAEQYWEGDCALPIFYRKAFEKKQQREFDNMDFNAWLHGRYIAEAISACFSKDSNYPEQPYSAKAEEQKKIAESKTEEEIMLEHVERFRNFVEAKNKNKGR